VKDDPFTNIRAQHAEWSDRQFGNVGPVGPLKHLAKEAIEAAEAQDDISEFADILMLVWDATRRAGFSDEQLAEAVAEKLERNKRRAETKWFRWAKWLASLIGQNRILTFVA
jgi:hypothetical protein